MEEAKEKTLATALVLEQKLREILAQDFIGWIEGNSGGGFYFILPNRKKFWVKVEEV